MTNAAFSNITRLGSAIAFVLVLVATITLLFGLLSARPAYAATFTVNSSSDGGDNDTTDNSCFTGNTKIVLVGGVLVRESECTLRAAVQQANATPGSDTITFSVNSVTLSTLGTLENTAETGDLDIKDDVTIDGSGVTIGADFGDRILHVIEGNATVNNVTLTGGEERSGGGIYVADRAGLELSDSILQNNAATSYSSDDSAFGGGIFNRGTVTVANSTIHDNYSELIATDGRAMSRGGGLYNEGGIMMVTTSTVDANYVSDDAEDTSSSALGQSGGGGIYNSGGNLTLTNDTISGNLGYGDTVGGGISNTGNVTVTNTTLYGNLAIYDGVYYSGAILNQPGGNFYVKNTLVASSVVSNCVWTESPIHSQGNNLEYPGNSCGFTGTGDIQNQDPRLGALADIGGPTQTHALLAGSPAIDAGTDTGCPATDQRGITRPQDGDNNGNATCDIGAFEAFTVDTTAPEAPVISSPVNNSYDTDGNVTVSGIAEAGSTVKLFEDGISEPLDTTTAGSSGNWSVALSGVAEDSHTYRATATDAAGNTSDVSTSVAVIVDKTAPTVTSVTPDSGVTDVLRLTNVTATFSEKVDQKTITNNVTSNVTLVSKKGKTASLVPATITPSSTTDGKTVVTLDPSVTLAKGTQYEARIKGGTGGVKDLAGNPLATDKIWSFTTATK